MKILLVAINAKYIHSNLAVYSLRAYAHRYTDHIRILELTINHSEEDILKEIYLENADVVAFSCYIWNISIVKLISEELRLVQPGVKIWFGGPEVSYDVRKSLNAYTQLDGIMIGEGEQTFLELVEYYVEGNNKLSEIAGLAYKESAGTKKEQSHTDIIITKDRQQLIMDAIPFPYEDMEYFKNRIIYYESSRGCPFSCSYCLSSLDKKVRFRSSELVKKELKRFLDYKVPQVKFVDRTFNCNKKHAMEIWQFVKDNDNGVTNFHFEISADLLEEDEMEFLATLRPGQVQFEIGVQSTNPDTVEAIHRKMDFPKVVKHVLRIKEGRNIHQHLDLIAGLPKEGYTTFEQSFRDVYRLKPDQLQLGFLKVLKGSSMEQDSIIYGITYRRTPPYEVLFTNALSYDELLAIKGVCEMVEVYYNSGQFTNSISYLEHFYESPMKLYQEINEFYQASGIALIAHSRVKRYEILLDFFKKVVLEPSEGESKPGLEKLFEELLTYDLFLREDYKTRPGFVAAQPKQSELRRLYDKYQINGKQIHIEHFSYDPIASVATGDEVKKATVVLFDYSKRDPLSKAAEITILDE